jgi:putative DNA primase/helicase
MTPYRQAAQWLLDNLERVSEFLFPNGQRDGHNFVVGDLNGKEGQSFSIALAPEAKRGLYKDFATGEKASRDLCQLWKTVRGISENDHARFFADLGGLAGAQFGYNPPREKGEKEFKCTPQEVEAWLADLKIADLKRLAQHRKRAYKLTTLGWLWAKQQQLAKRRDQIVFLMRNPAEVVVGVHRWFEAEGKLKFLGPPTLFAFGDSESAGEVHINESVWDQIALADRTGWHLEKGILFLCTRGTSNTELLRGRIPPGAKVYLWEQHDQPDENGKCPNQDWQAKAAKLAIKAGCQVYVVKIPPQFKDLNEWTLAGATAEELAQAREAEEPYEPPKSEEEPFINGIPSELDRLETIYHGPTLLDAKGKPKGLNERFWAAHFASENPTVYEPFEDRIHVYQPERGLFVAQHPEKLREALASRMNDIAASRGGHYHAVERFITMRALGGVIEALKGIAYSKEAFSRHPGEPVFLHLANCMLVRNGEGFVQEQFSPHFRSRNQSPIPYDPKAGEEDFRRAFFPEKFDANDLGVIQKYAGQCLLGRYLTQTILLLDGVADSSKTTLALVISEVIGADNCAQLRTSQLDQRFEASSFIGKSILLAPDVKANFLSLYGASILKSLVGGDRMLAEFKSSNRRVSFDGVYNVIITSNCRLRAKLEGDADAWRRRLLIVRFDIARTGQRIADFHHVLVRNHGPGILNFMISGALALLNELESQGRIVTTAQQQARISKFIDESDSLRQFLRANLSLCLGSPNNLTVNEILEAYFQDCINNELNSLPTKEASRSLVEIVKDLFGRPLINDVRRNGRSQKGFAGIAWRPADDPDPPDDVSP